MRTSIYALATLSGTIIGVGLFVLPYIASQVGLWVMLGYFGVLGSIAILVHLLFAEVVMRTAGQHRLPGYAEIYLGKAGKIISLISVTLGLGGALFSYLVVGGNFFYELLSPFLGGQLITYLIVYLIAGAILIYSDIRGISKIEFFGLILFFIVLITIYLKGVLFVRPENLFTSVAFFKRSLFLPYGPILFSLWGAALIPEITEMMQNRQKSLKKIIPLAIIIAGLTYLAFIFLVTGITGINTSESAIVGLKKYFGDGVIILGLIFGVLTTFTSYITLGLTLKKSFCYDLKIRPFIAWLAVCLGPFILYLLGLTDFLKVIGFIGGTTIGVEGIIIILAYHRAKSLGTKEPRWSLHLPKLFSYSLIIFLVLGIIYEVIYFIR